MKRITCFCLLMILSVFVSAQSDATLEETLDWIKNKIDVYGEIELYDKNDYSLRVHVHNQIFKYSGCTAYYSYDWTTSTTSYPHRNTINFSDLDIKNIEVRYDPAQKVGNSIHDWALPTTKMWGILLHKLNTRDYIWIYLNDEDLANRMVNALKHAMELCGCEEEKF